MLTSKKRTDRRNKKKTSLAPNTPAIGDLQRLFGRSRSGSPELKMADPWSSRSQTPDRMVTPDISEGSRSPKLYANSPDPAEVDLNRSPRQPFMVGADAELKAILQALPTRADIEALVGKVEAAHRKELRAVKQEVQLLNTRLSSGETTLAALEQRVSSLESR